MSDICIFSGKNNKLGMDIAFLLHIMIYKHTYHRKIIVYEVLQNQSTSQINVCHSADITLAQRWLKAILQL